MNELIRRNTIYILLSIVILGSSCNKKQKEISHMANTVLPKPILDTTVNLAGGKLYRIDSFPSKFVKPRTVEVWLPDGYSKDKKYAVLYMNDGQMLFDSTKTWNKQEWAVDETLSRLMTTDSIKDVIVVAIWNIPEIRWQDYYPEKSWDFIPGDIQRQLIEEAKANAINVEFNADNYLKFITEELKPLIDQDYPVHTDTQHTIIAGSSMGGLISMYAVFERPEVFGGAICMSTHWTGSVPPDPGEDNPMAKGFFDYMKSKNLDPKTHKIYFDYGTETLDADYVQYASAVDEIFKEKGFDNSNYKNLKFEGDAHDEISWAKRLHIPIVFFLGKHE